MKRFRVTCNDGEVHKVPFFETAEGLYLWCNTMDNELRGAEIVTLRPSDFIDVEFIGCEFVHEGEDRYTYLNLLNAGLARASDNESGHVIKPILGWVAQSVLPLIDKSINGLTIRRLGIGEGIKLEHPIGE
jgi:hypothetical protein